MPIPLLTPSTSQQFFHRSILSQPDAHLRPDLIAFLQDAHFDDAFFVELSPYEQQQGRCWLVANRGEADSKPQSPTPTRPNDKTTFGSAAPSESIKSRPRVSPARPSSTLSLTDNEAPERGQRGPDAVAAPPTAPEPASVSVANLQDSPFYPLPRTTDALDARSPGATHRGFFAGVRRRFGEFERSAASKVERNV